jgi:hypothetical protein
MAVGPAQRQGAPFRKPEEKSDQPPQAQPQRQPLGGFRPIPERIDPAPAGSNSGAFDLWLFGGEWERWVLR